MAPQVSMLIGHTGKKRKPRGHSTFHFKQDHKSYAYFFCYENSNEITHFLTSFIVSITWKHLDNEGETKI